MTAPPTLIVTREDARRLMSPADYLQAVEQGFLAAARGDAEAPAPMHIAAVGGAFHAKGARITLPTGTYVALKFNGNFPTNPARHGLPTIQGAVILADGARGNVLALLDSIEITLQRTAAASALAARHLARPDSRTILVCGCGEQGRVQLAALAAVLPLERCLAWDVSADATERLARETARPGLRVEAVADLAAAAREADVIVTCTTARAPFLGSDHVRPGTFVAAVGADNPDKSEIAPELMAAAKVVTDVLDQCAEIGDLRHALAAGTMRRGDVHAELSEIVSGARPGRGSDDEIFIFDSTGTALQDVAAAAMIYERCRDAGSVPTVALSAAH